MTDDPWLKTSIMATRDLAKGQAGKRHELTIEKQGPFHYVYGPYAKPVLTIDPGDVVAVETEDAFGGVITSEKDSPTAKLQFPFLNPQCGPIAVNGIEKGDCLAVHIHAVETRGAQPAGKTCIIPEFGGLVGTASTALLNPPLPERVRVMHVDKNGVRWSDRITLPYQPFIGTIGISPEIEAISSLQPDYHGGNMDLPDVAPGAILYFPVHVKGGFLYVGDCHAAQGDGELSGVAIEQRATVTMQVDVIKGWSFAWPRLETKEFLMTIGSARPLEDAARIAYRELVRWMSAEYGFDEIDAYMLLSQAGRIRLGNMVDAMTLAVEEANAAGGLLGRQIKLINYDTQSNMQLYTQFAQQAALKDKVAVVHGGITSASREVIRPVLDKFKTLYFYNTQYEGGVCDRNQFDTGVTPAQTVEKLVPHAMKKWGKKVYVVAADYNYGQT